MRQKGKFWPAVRKQIWTKAQELFQEDEARTMDEDFKGITATHSELREGGYYHEAKLLVLRDLHRIRKGLPTAEEDTNPC